MGVFFENFNLNQFDRKNSQTKICFIYAIFTVTQPFHLKNVNKEMKSCYFKRYFPILALFLLVTIILLNLPKNTKKSVPNVVHFVLLKEANETDIDFIGATCILAAFLNQEPEKIVLHTNVILKGKYFGLVHDLLETTLEVRKVQRPTHVFGYPLSSGTYYDFTKIFYFSWCFLVILVLLQ